MKNSKNKIRHFLILLVLLLTTAWVTTAPPAYIEIAPPYSMGETPPSIEQVRDKNEIFSTKISADTLKLPGTDEFVLQEHLGRGFATAMDGWIWKIDLKEKAAERFVDVPLMAAGAVNVPGNDDEIYFCASHLSGETYPENENVGLYKLSISTKRVSLLVDRVPLPPEITPKSSVVYPFGKMPGIKTSLMTQKNSRPLAFCNDLAVHSSGDRIYFTEPFDYENASMGGGAFREAISLGQHGRLWLYDLKLQEVKLVAQNFTFIDGVLIEEKDGELEESILITETVKFRMLRFYLRGEKAGSSEIVWDDLPGMPDGMERDVKGNIWIGLVKIRSELVTWIHANPWIKHILLRLPYQLFPVNSGAGVLALSPNADTPLYYAEHKNDPGHISVVVPGSERLYLPNFDKTSKGVFSMVNPL